MLSKYPDKNKIPVTINLNYLFKGLKVHYLTDQEICGSSWAKSNLIVFQQITNNLATWFDMIYLQNIIKCLNKYSKRTRSIETFNQCYHSSSTNYGEIL